MEIVKNYVKFLAVSFILAVIFLCISAAVLTYTNVSDNMLWTFVFVTVILSTLLGSVLLNRKTKKKGIINGSAFGVIFFIIIYLISAILRGSVIFNSSSLTYFGMSVGSGIIGGIIGVNI